MKKFRKFIALFFSIAILGGCTHTIQLTPPLDNIREVKVENKIDKNVGYYIDEKDLNKEVVSAGGGGDKVSYQPYKDTEAALNTMLSRVFSKVYSIEDISDTQYLAKKNISYVFKPSIKTDSSSSSVVTWPPTEFLFELTCAAVDSKGVGMWKKTVQATGNAEFSEFNGDFSLSARRASDQAYQKMLIEISKTNEFK